MIKLKELLKEGIFSSWMVDKAVMIANKMSGNMTGAVKAIEKLKKGLSKDKKVADALRQANESVKEAIPKWPRINMGCGEAQDYSKMMIKKSEMVFKSTRAGDMGKAKKAVKDMEEIVVQIKRVLGI